ncbi:LysM domain/BON superfamily protein [Luteitalea pratensis]|uniref:Potassium binding protein Kbp n=1 Tax=Luteitalea pratensis TaxID=1855912 RepID=A0A143PJF1_LUTPR|nr:LysM peptidoglycan-binding domain-containing protein [Luteitalea pratensis]AMY07899.1 LysM domain/BON superfamily protein [Luteitalea pratensis]
MSLRDKYAAAIHVAKSVGMQGAAEEANGRLQFKGTVTSEDDKNKIWDALKSVPTWKDELNAQIDVVKPTAITYTVQSGDTLSKIAKAHLGDANAYMKIFDANKDQLSDPDKIKVGQVLTIPSA